MHFSLEMLGDVASFVVRHCDAVLPTKFGPLDHGIRPRQCSPCCVTTSRCDGGRRLSIFPAWTCNSRRSLQGGPVCEGMALGEHSPTSLKSRVCGSFCRSARCNRGPRKQASVGNGRPLRETVPNAKRPTECRFIPSQTASNPCQGWSVLTLSLISLFLP